MNTVRGVSRITPLRQVRRFHQTRPAPFINEALEVSTSFVHGVHSISHLPWALSLPLTAFLVRMGVALPLQIFTKAQGRKDGELAPILQSWRHHYEQQAKRKKSSTGSPLLRSEAKRLVSEEVKQQHRVLRQRWGVYRFWKPASFLQMPVWIMIMESIRGMSGNDKGFLSYLRSLFDPSFSPAGNTPHLAVEPSLATEGALWFPDLLAGDHTGLLPIVLGVSILANVGTGFKVPALKEIADMPRLELVKNSSLFTIRTIIQGLAVYVGYASYSHEMPTALLLYWITSTNIATLQSFLLQKYMFPTPSVKPWRQIYIGYVKGERKSTA
ncbi:hypothetical protein BJX99DRAFT_249401 [Aspergillus californicus]